MLRSAFCGLRGGLSFFVLPLLFGSPLLHAQTINFGVKFGVPLTDYFETGSIGGRNGGAQYTSATRRYTFGLAGEYRMKNGLGLEIDALYHRMGYKGAIFSFNQATGVATNSNIDVFGNSWDFPLMVKYHVHHPLRPYVEGGFVLRWIASARETGVQTISSGTAIAPLVQIGTNDVSDLRKSLYPGVTVGGGVELGPGRLHLLPEFRYTRWTANIAGSGGLLRFDPNQAEIMLGLSF